MKKLPLRFCCGIFFCTLTIFAFAQKTNPYRKYSTVERLQLEHLRAVNTDRLRYQQQRKTLKIIKGVNDYRAIMHVHAEDSAHTGGTRPELLADCKKAGVNIVMLTNHWRPPVDFINDSWRGMRDGVLFIPGTEYEGFLAYPQKSIIKRPYKGTAQFTALVKEGGGDIFLSHMEERPDWTTAPLTGMEIYNHHADFKPEIEFLGWLQRTLADPDGIKQFRQIVTDFPQEVFGAQQDYLQNYIAKWDADSQNHRVTGVAANDCHHNQVITVKVGAPDVVEIWLTGDKEASFKVNSKRAPRIPELTSGKQAGDIIAQFDLDPYERSLRYVTTHILAKKQNEKSVREALRQSHAYVSHDWFCDPTGFAFVTKHKSRQVGIMGDEVKWTADTQLQIAAPTSGKIRLFHNGKIVQETIGDKMDFTVKETGNYRAEIWLEFDGEWRPWVYANPIKIV